MSSQITKDSFGLLANGSCDPWHIDIDETTSGPDRWWMQIEGPSIYISFEVPSLDVVSKMAQFLESKNEDTLDLGIAHPTPVTLVRDNEFVDRFFLKIGTNKDAFVDFTIAGEDVGKLSDALRQVQEDLND